MRELEKRKGQPFTEIERGHLEERLAAARYWVDRYASEAEKTRLQERIPTRAEELSASQRAFLRMFAEAVHDVPWEEDAIQACIFDVARLTPIEAAQGFKAIYRVLLDRENGPRAGSLLSFLNPDFVVGRCSELSVEVLSFLHETSMTAEAFAQWLGQHRGSIVGMVAAVRATDGVRATGVTHPEPGVIEFKIETADGKRLCRRVLLEGPKNLDATEWIASLERAGNVAIPIAPQPRHFSSWN